MVVSVSGSQHLQYNYPFSQPQSSTAASSATHSSASQSTPSPQGSQPQGGQPQGGQTQAAPPFGSMFNSFGASGGGDLQSQMTQMQQVSSAVLGDNDVMLKIGDKVLNIAITNFVISTLMYNMVLFDIP